MPALRARACSGDGGVFVLIDPLVGDPVLQDPLPADLDTSTLNLLRSQGWERSCHSLSLPPQLELDSALSPYLVELSGSDDPWLETSLVWALRETVRSWLAPVDAQPTHRVGGWLHTAAFGPALARKLSGWVALSTRASSTSRYLRLADRRVWGLALHVLGQVAVAQRMPPVQCWQWIDAHAALCEVSALIGQAATADDAGPLVQFNGAQWGLMELGQSVHGFLAAQRGQRLDDPNEAPTHWLPVSSAEWQLALQAASAATGANKKSVSQEGNPV
jgi:hypothetical protein